MVRTMTTRRSFLAGLLATAVAPAMPPDDVMDLCEASLETMIIQLRTGALVQSMRQTKLIVAANIFSQAWADGIFNHGFNAGGDGVALTSSAHPST